MELSYTCLMDPRILRVIQTTYFSLLTHAKQVSLATIFERTAEIRKKGVTYVRTEGQTDVKSEVVI